jgi:hypothetical protein
VGVIMAIDDFDVERRGIDGKPCRFSTFAVSKIRGQVSRRTAKDNKHSACVSINMEEYGMVVEFRHQSDRRRAPCGERRKTVHVEPKIMPCASPFAGDSLDDREVSGRVRGVMVSCQSRSREAGRMIDIVAMRRGIDIRLVSAACVDEVRWGVGGFAVSGPMTLLEIAGVFGLSRERIRQLEEKGDAMLGKALAAAFGVTAGEPADGKPAGETPAGGGSAARCREVAARKRSRSEASRRPASKCPA